MKRFNLSWLFILSLLLFISVAVAQEKLWVSSESAKLKQERKISSRTISTLPIGTEVEILISEGRWYRILAPSGEEGWMYRGRLSGSPPAKEVQDESGDLFAFMPGSSIQADEADTARSIRGLSRETEQYANNRGTPAAYRSALDRVLAMGVEERELERFLMKGKIGEYAP
ncbi:MAG: SH3 domain-containing protein [Deltaproteobacteria bacterium]|nr:SH3 domain-containing protein [Deltaproteobacteria bacterium]